MARLTTPLTNIEVKQTRPKDKLYKLSDGGGLQLRVMPNGSKQWLLDYFKPFTKKRTTFALGNYPDVSIADARKKRTFAKELLAKNIDPKGELTGTVTPKTFKRLSFKILQKSKGKPHNSIIRSLAFKWIRIVFRCWKTNTPYDESKYLEALKRRGSPLLKFAINS